MDLTEEQRKNSKVGLRFNTNKSPMEILPPKFVHEFLYLFDLVDGKNSTLNKAMVNISNWNINQSGEEISHPMIEAAIHLSNVYMSGYAKGVEKSPLSILRGIAEVFAYGEKKYARHNWLKGMNWSVMIGCASRHTEAMSSGEEFDPESNLPHAFHAIWNCMGAFIYEVENLGTDDRYYKVLEEIREFIKE